MSGWVGHTRYMVGVRFKFVDGLGGSIGFWLVLLGFALLLSGERRLYYTNSTHLVFLPVVRPAISLVRLLV